MSRFEVGKWEYTVSIHRGWEYNADPFVRNVTIGIFKLLEKPTEGQSVKGMKYNGFILRLRFWWPIIID